MEAASELLDRWHRLRAEVETHGARLIAVSKYAPDEAVEALIEAGQRDFGESRPQQLRDRARRWPECRWHMIGPLQRNKAKYVARHAAVWHSCEDLDTARAVASVIEREGIRPLPVLVQVRLSGLAHQHGVEPERAGELVDALRSLAGLRVVGLMGMAPREPAEAASAFRRLAALRAELDDGSLAELSMGMSGDFRLALECGATWVRLGSVLFGPQASPRTPAAKEGHQ